MTQHIGQDFSKSIKLNLLPGVDIQRGHYQIQIQYFTDVAGVTTMHSQAMNSDGRQLEAIFGTDVRSIEFLMYRLNNQIGANPYWRYSLRVDQLILLNLALRLLSARLK